MEIIKVVIRPNRNATDHVTDPIRSESEICHQRIGDEPGGPGPVVRGPATSPVLDQHSVAAALVI